MRIIFTVVYLLLMLDSLASAEEGVSIEPAPPLLSGYGYLVVDAEVHQLVKEWKLSRTIAIRDIAEGHNIRLLPLKPGKYHWQSISIPLFDLPFRVALNEENDVHWGFEIKKDRLNYIGRLMVGEKRATDSVEISLINRLVMTHSQLQAVMPQVLNEYPMVYSGFLKDDFSEFLNDETKTVSE